MEATNDVDSPGLQSKKPACNPCRASKVACGHEQPVCKRCIERGRSATCVYRDAPFKKRKTHHQDDSVVVDRPISVAASSPAQDVQDDTIPSHRYPNPGYLGSSSGFAIFNEVQSMSATPIGDGAQSPYDSQANLSGDLFDDQGILSRSTHVLDRLACFDIRDLSKLVISWLDTGANLALAEPFVLGCVNAMLDCPWRQEIADMETGSREQARAFSQRAKLLSRNTCKAIVLTAQSDFNAYLDQMAGPRIRWETLGLFYAAAAKAVCDVDGFQSLYKTDERRRKLARSLTYIVDCCLEVCLAHDCLNDLQLILQYEQFHLHSRIHGDQSFRTWRSMGDLATSLVTLGYHEKLVQGNASIPNFVLELRKSIFARVFWADKTISSFVGRPPRVLLSHCNFQVPEFHFDGNLQVIDYVADTICSARFAVYKELSLEVFRMRQSSDQAGRADQVRRDLEQLWSVDMPPHLRLTTNLAATRGTPFVKDFLVNQRLEYLHTHFLLGLTHLQTHTEPDQYLLQTSGEMLGLVVEIILLRNKLVNSGSNWLWKVAHFGLPAAGVISLALLRRSGTSTPTKIKSQMIQNLCVLVAEVRSGAVVSPGEPSFELFNRATRTIQSILDSSLTLAAPSAHMTDLPDNAAFDLGTHWNPDMNFEPWEFEADFWENLATHPTIAGMENRAA